jgi:hypothetical protein
LATLADSGKSTNSSGTANDFMLNLTAVDTNLLSPSEYVQDMIMSGCVRGDSSAEGDLDMIQL